jgi:hypothetical protein
MRLGSPDTPATAELRGEQYRFIAAAFKKDKES